MFRYRSQYLKSISKCPLLRVHCSLQGPIAPIAQLPIAQGSCQEASQAPSSRPLPKCPSAPSLQGSQVKPDLGPDVDPDPDQRCKKFYVFATLILMLCTHYTRIELSDDGDANVVAADDHDDDDAQCPECKELRCFVIDVILC